MTLDPDSKINWLLAKGLLSDISYRHEAFAILETSFAAASQDLKDAVWAVGWSEYERSVDSSRPWESAFAVWINRVDPEFEPAATAVEVFSDEHPDWAPSAHPNYINYMGEVTVIPPSRLPPEIDAAPTYTVLRELELAEPSGLAVTNLQDAVAAKVGNDPTLGVALLREAAQDGAWDSVLWNAARHGLERADIPQNLWPEFFEAVLAHPEVQTGLDILSSVLLDAVEKDPPGIAADQFGDAAQAIGSLLENLEAAGSDIDDPGNDILSVALNSWPGRLAHYLVQTAGVLEQQEQSPCAAPGLEAFARTVHASREANWSKVALAALGRLFPYLLDRCPTLTLELILPAFDWEAPEVASAAWHGIAYAHWSRQTVKVLRPFLVGAAQRLGLFEGQARHGLCRTMASIALSPGDDSSAPEEWFEVLIAESEDPTRAMFARCLRGTLEGLSEDERSAAWEEWLRRWLTRRVAGYPTSIGPEEASIILGWIFPLSAHSNELVDLVIASPVADRGFGFLHELSESTIPVVHPTQAAQLVAHVLSSRPQSWHLPEIERILRVAHQEGADPSALSKACNELVGLGGPKLDLCPDA